MNVLWNRGRTRNVAFRKADRSFAGRILGQVKKLITSRAVIFIIIPLTLIIGGLLLIRYMGTDKFKVTEVNYYGAKLTQPSSLESVKGEFLNKNIFLLSTKSAEKKIKENGSYIEEVYVEKILPSTLEVHIVEKDPKAVYVNFSNAYLIDKDYKVVDTLSQMQEFSVGSEELEIIRGYGSLDSPEVINRILADKEDVTEENKAEIIAAITLEEKSNTINMIRAELVSAIESDFQKHADLVSKSRFWHLPVMYAYETKQLQIGDRISRDDVKDITDSERIKMFLEIDDFFQSHEQFQVERYVWESEFKMEVRLVGGQYIYFSPKRKLDLQKEDLILVTNALKMEGSSFQSIDLSADKIVVEK